MEIDILQFTKEEANIIIEKMEVLDISYRRQNNIITILDRIDTGTYAYLIDFSRV